MNNQCGVDEMPQVRISGDLVSAISILFCVLCSQTERTKDDLASVVGTRSVVASE